MCSCVAKLIGSNVYGSRALDHFGRITQPKVLTQDNAWSVRRYDWNRNGNMIGIMSYNYLTEERRPLTEDQQQYNTIINDQGHYRTRWQTNHLAYQRAPLRGAWS